MKKILTTFPIIVFFLFASINVYAEEQTITALPKAYTSGEYTYSIDGFELRAYEMNNSDDSEGLLNFIKGAPDKTIPLNDADLKISPETKDSTINDVPTTLVDVNFNITSAKLEQYLTNAGLTATAEKSYLVEIVLNYKLTKGKIESAHIYNFNFAKTFFGSFMGENNGIQETALNTPISQTLNIAVVTYNNETSKSQAVYETTVTEENGIAAYVLNYLATSTTPVTGTNDAIDDILMFHNIDNVDYLIESLKKVEDDAKEDNGDGMKDVITNNNNNSNNPNGQVVKVENTAAKVPRHFWIISIMMIILGTSIIGYTVTKSN